MEHILSLSYGKDSLACLGAIEQLGWPLDRIVHAEVWATDTIPADLPPMVEFKARADKIIKERWNIEVEHISVTKKGKKWTYEDNFYKRVLPETLEKRFACKNWVNRGISYIYGFPSRKGPWCNKLKFRGSLGWNGAVTYAGIAADEAKRIERWTGKMKMPLVEIEWTEADCRRWCEENDLLSPIYKTATRGGCWFCHNQSVDQLRLLRKNYPDYWALMLKWDSDSPVAFKSDGHTVHDYDRRFALEDMGLVPMTGTFRWSMVSDYDQWPIMPEVLRLRASGGAINGTISK